MIGVIVIAVVFTALAVGIGYGATRGKFRGVGAALLTTSRSGSRLLNTSLVVVYLGVGIAVPLIFIIGNRDKSDAQVGGLKLTASEQVGRELFGEHCAVCHTLAADNAVGKVGPNLDQLKPPKSLVLHTLANGCLQNLVGKDYNSICLGYGNMPADIVQGRQAEDVAAFVARVAGHT
jgi:mono/diheme cytochrome c family protein